MANDLILLTIRFSSGTKGLFILTGGFRIFPLLPKNKNPTQPTTNHSILTHTQKLAHTFALPISPLRGGGVVGSGVESTQYVRAFSMRQRIAARMQSRCCACLAVSIQQMCFQSVVVLCWSASLQEAWVTHSHLPVSCRPGWGPTKV